MLKLLDKQIAAVAQHINDYMDRQFKAQRALLNCVKGWPATMLTLTAALRELGCLVVRIDDLHQHRPGHHALHLFEEWNVCITQC